MKLLCCFILLSLQLGCASLEIESRVKDMEKQYIVFSKQFKDRWVIKDPLGDGMIDRMGLNMPSLDMVVAEVTRNPFSLVYKAHVGFDGIRTNLVRLEWRVRFWTIHKLLYGY